MKIDVNKSCAVIKGVKTVDDFHNMAKKLLKKLGNKKILYVFTTPDGEAIIIVFK